MTQLFLFSLVFWFSQAQALTDRERFPTCASFADEIENSKARVSSEELQNEIQTTDIVIIAETHNHSHFLAFQPFLENILHTSDFDCLLLEAPSDVMTDNNKQFQGPASQHPYILEATRASSFRKPWYEHLKTLILGAEKQGLKIFHIDFPQKTLIERDHTLQFVEEQNAFLGASISELFQKKICRRALVQLGMGHVTPTFYRNMSFASQTIKSVPEQESLQDYRLMSINISAGLFDYLLPESLPLCYKGSQNQIVKTTDFKTNFPYSQNLGKIKDFTHLFIPSLF